MVLKKIVADEQEIIVARGTFETASYASLLLLSVAFYIYSLSNTRFIAYQWIKGQGKII